MCTSVVPKTKPMNKIDSTCLRFILFKTTCFVIPSRKNINKVNSTFSTLYFVYFRRKNKTMTDHAQQQQPSKMVKTITLRNGIEMPMLVGCKYL